MAGFKNKVTSLSKFLDLIGGYFLFALMLVVVFNVIMRTLFSKPFIGTVEIVEVFYAVAVGLTISYCAILDEHISIDFILEKFPQKFQNVVAFIVNILTIIFLGISSLMIFKYGESVRQNGLVTPTMGIGYYPFVYIIALGVFVYFLVALIRTFELFGRKR
ncbi:MAG: TRAP transporter small permease [Desulfuromusa sp.]|nr:TRAP transporter small permease [Desulfuromusa sp.]